VLFRWHIDTTVL